MQPPQHRPGEPGGGWPRGPRGRDPSKKKSAPICAKIFCRWAGMWGGVPRRRQVDPGITLRAPRPGANVPNHVNSPWGTDTPGVATRKLGGIWTKLAGDLPQTEAHLPRRRQVWTSTPRREALAGVKCAKSRLGAAGRGRGPVRGGDGCSPACLNPLGTLTEKVSDASSRVPPWIHRPREPWGEAAAWPLVPLPLEKSNSRQGFALSGR